MRYFTGQAVSGIIVSKAFVGEAPLTGQAQLNAAKLPCRRQDLTGQAQLNAAKLPCRRQDLTGQAQIQVCLELMDYAP